MQIFHFCVEYQLEVSKILLDTSCYTLEHPNDRVMDLWVFSL